MLATLYSEVSTVGLAPRREQAHFAASRFDHRAVSLRGGSYKHNGQRGAGPKSWKAPWCLRRVPGLITMDSLGQASSQAGCGTPVNLRKRMLRIGQLDGFFAGSAGQGTD